MNAPTPHPDDAASRPTVGQRIRKWASRAVFAYLGVLLVLALFETRLVYPIPSRDAANWAPDFAFQDIHFSSGDGAKLHGWLLPSAAPCDRWIVYFHGNGDHVPNIGVYLDQLRSYLPANIFVFDYRGYGKSEGKPFESGVLADGEAAVEWVCQHAKLQPTDVILMGRSLGGGVAVHVAAKQGAKALVLERTFTSLTDTAASHYPWLPVKWVMRNRFRSIDKISQYKGPLLSSHGTIDRVVPYHLGEQLFAAAGSDPSQRRFITMPEIGHNGPGTLEYDVILAAFLRSSGSQFEP